MMAEEADKRPGIDLSMKLSGFRRDLVLREGPIDPDGAPTYTLYDPIRAQYFHLTWAEVQIYSLLLFPSSLGHVMKMLDDTTVRVSPEEVIQFLTTAKFNRLLDIKGDTEGIISEAGKRKGSWFKWFLFHYLYFRIPLINPNAFLEKTRSYVRPLYSRPFFIGYFCAMLIAFYIVLTRFSEYTSTFFYFFNIKGLAAYMTGIIAVKLVHEFSHAYSAALLGIRVPAMGVAFIVLWPVLYTDVTDSWKLKSRRDRFFIAFAGVGSELVLAAFCTIGWALTDAGILHSMFFVVSSITWVSSLFMNLNPAMRFDGYYMFSDWVGVSNLQLRAFALTRWKLRKVLLGIETEYPERRVSPSKENLLTIYSIYTLCYRLVLYTSIAILVYFKFTKVIGVVLFLVEIIFFIIYPIIWEAKELYKLRQLWHWNWRVTVLTATLLLFFAWAVIPWRHTAYFPAITVPVKEQIVYTPNEGKIIDLFVEKEEVVNKGDPIILIESFNLNVDLTEAKIEKLKQERAYIRALSSGQGQSSVDEIEKTINYFQKKIESIEAKLHKNEVVADMSGIVYRLNDQLNKGENVSAGTVVGSILPSDGLKLIAFIDAYFYPDVSKGDPAIFYYTNGVRKEVRGTVINIEPQRVFELVYPQLASINGGSLAVHEPKSKTSLGFPLEKAYFSVEIALDHQKEGLAVDQPGEVAMKGPRQSLAVKWLRYVIQIFWRESSF